MMQTAPHSELKPLILMADSQILFYKEKSGPYMRRLHQLFPQSRVNSAAYIGAANGDKSEFYDMFEMAMHAIEVFNCRHIKSDPSEQDIEFLSQADVILLAGGNIHQGWQSIQKLSNILVEARNRGAILIGTSAGAIHLGSIGWHDKPYLSNTDLFSTLGLIPAMFSAHEEKKNWQFLKQLVNQTAGCLPGIGIPSGAGVIVMPNNSMQAIRKPMVVMTLQEKEIEQQSLWHLRLDELQQAAATVSSVS